MDLQQYLPVILFILVGLAFGVVPLVAGFLLGPDKPDAQKNSPFECGFEAFEDARMKFDVRYYLVAILFILFDLEIAFFFPWAVALRDRRLLIPRNPHGRLPLRMEEGRPQLGVIAVTNKARSTRTEQAMPAMAAMLRQRVQS